MNHLEFERRRRGWTQMQVSDVTRIAQYYISELERGAHRTRPTADQLHRLAVALDLPENLLLAEVPKVAAPVAAPAAPEPVR